MLSVRIATGVLCIGFLWAKSVSVFKNNDCQYLAKALMFDPALKAWLKKVPKNGDYSSFYT